MNSLPSIAPRLPACIVSMRGESQCRQAHGLGWDAGALSCIARCMCASHRGLECRSTYIGPHPYLHAHTADRTRGPFLRLSRLSVCLTSIPDFRRLVQSGALLRHHCFYWLISGRSGSNFSFLKRIFRVPCPDLSIPRCPIFRTIYGK
jgi:hypothetical protein